MEHSAAIKTLWGTTSGLLGTAAIWAFGTSGPYMPILLVLIIIDTVFGVLRARQPGNGGITSSGFRRICKKVIFYAGSIVAVNLAVTALGLAPTVLITLVYILIGCEALSILEHARLSGYMPEEAETFLKKLTGGIKSSIDSTISSSPNNDIDTHDDGE